MLGEGRDQQSIFEHMYQHAPIGVAIVSMKGEWLKINPALSHILGYSELEIKRISFDDISYPKDHKGFEKMSKLAEEHITNDEIEQRFIRKDGSIVYTSLHISCVRDESDVPMYFVSYVIDITEKKKAEQKLLDTEELYRLISNNAQEMIFYLSPEGRWNDCSPSVLELLGYHPSELIGLYNEELFHPDDLDAVHQMVSQELGVVQYRFRQKSGNYRWFETTVQKVTVANAVNFLCVGRDITERKRSEEMLNEAERIAAIGSWEWDIKHKKIELSEQVYRICRMDRDKLDVATFNILDFVDKRDRADLERALRKALKGSTFNYEYRLIHDNDATQYFHLKGIVSYDNNGRPLKMIGTIQDITERIEMELKLQETVERYTSLKKYNHDAVISLDLKGNIVHGNMMAEKLTGYSIKEMAGMSLTRFTGVRNLSKVLKDSLKDKASNHSIDYFEHKDGRSIEVMTTIAPIIINEENVGFYVIAKDITEQKKLLIEKETAESTNRAKSAFLAMMSHEIRTPMNGVIGMTDLLMDSDGLDEEQREYVRIIRKSGESLLNIINDILDFSKIESGKTTLVHEPFRLHEVIDETFDLLNPKAIQKNLKMAYTMTPEIPKIMIGDAERLKQVLINILGNALKFTFTGGVYMNIQKLESEPEQIQLEFTIQDTGIGIPDEKVEGLFQPFYQLDHFMTRKHEGTGLGLAISRKLVEMMNGEIWIEPSDQPGATFKFTVIFDRNEMAVENEGDVSSLSPLEQNKNLQILVGEDNETNQLVIQKMLEKSGYQVDIASSGKEVLAKVQQKPYDLIFMDVQMPEVNGLEATQAIKKMFPLNEVPVIIAVTANALKGDREYCISAGMDDYISKPIKRTELIEVIERYFG